MLEQGLEWNWNADRVGERTYQASGGQGRTTGSKKIVVHAQVRSSQAASEALEDGPLKVCNGTVAQSRTRSREAGSGTHQSASVDCAVLAERQPIHRLNAHRDEVVGQLLAKLTQYFLGIECPRCAEGHQALAVAGGDHGGGVDAEHRAKDRLRQRRSDCPARPDPA